MPEFYVYDPEKAWQSSLDASRETDPMLHDARLLSEIHDVVKSNAKTGKKTYQTKKVMKYSTEWWRDWKKKTKISRVKTRSGAATPNFRHHQQHHHDQNDDEFLYTKPFNDTTHQDRYVAPKVLNKVDLTRPGHDISSITKHVETFETVLSVDSMHSLNVEDLMNQSRRKGRRRRSINYDNNDEKGDDNQSSVDHSKYCSSSISTKSVHHHQEAVEDSTTSKPLKSSLKSSKPKPNEYNESSSSPSSSSQLENDNDKKEEQEEDDLSQRENTDKTLLNTTIEDNASLKEQEEDDLSQRENTDKTLLNTTIEDNASLKEQEEDDLSQRENTDKTLINTTIEDNASLKSIQSTTSLNSEAQEEVQDEEEKESLNKPSKGICNFSATDSTIQKEENATMMKDKDDDHKTEKGFKDAEELTSFITNKPGIKFGTEQRSFNHKNVNTNISPGPIYHPNTQYVKMNDGGLGCKFSNGKRSNSSFNISKSTDAIYKLPDTIATKYSSKTSFGQGSLRSWDQSEKKEFLIEQARYEAEKEIYEKEIEDKENNEDVYDNEYDYEEDEEYDEYDDDDDEDGEESQNNFRYKNRRQKNRIPQNKRKKNKEKEVFPCKMFGYGCSVEEHIAYGQCIDGLCCQRSHLEKVMGNKVKKINSKKSLKTSRLQEHSSHRRIGLLNKDNDDDGPKKTALHYACEQNKLSIIHEMLIKGAQIDSIDEYGRTPLSIASESGHIRIVTRLLMNSQYPEISPKGFVNERFAPNINVVDLTGKTPLHYAAIQGHHLIVKKLLDSGASAEVQDHNQQTALDLCTSSLAYQHLRARGEVFIRRERYEGIILKSNLVDSNFQIPKRLEYISKTNNLQEEVNSYKTANQIMTHRIERIDNDILHFKAKGNLKYKSSVLQQDALLINDELTKFCYENQNQSSEELLDMLNIGTNNKKHHHHKHRCRNTGNQQQKKIVQIT